MSTGPDAIAALFPWLADGRLTELSAEQARAAWLSLPAALRNPYHDPRYVACDAVSKGYCQPLFLAYREQSALYLHFSHWTQLPAWQISDLESPRGYGGPLSTSTEPAFLANAWQAVQQWQQRHRVLVEFIRFSPVLANQRYSNADCWPDRATVCIDLTQYDLSSLPGKCRNMVRKAERQGAICQLTRHPDSAQLQAFLALYEQRMNSLQATAQYRYDLAYLEQLLTLDTCWLAEVHCQATLCAAALFLGAGQTLEYHLSSANALGMQIGATNLLIHHACQQGQAQFTRLHLGGGTRAAPDDSLFRFKASFSDLRCQYQTGRVIVDPIAYAALKQQLGDQSTRAIFYR